MSTVLLVESGLASLLAIPLGYLLDKKKGALTLFASVAFPTGLISLLAWLVCGEGKFPIYQVSATVNVLPDNYLGVACLVLEIAIWTVLLAATFGYFFNKEVGAGLLAGVVFVLTFVTFWISVWLGDQGPEGSDLPLLFALFVMGLLLMVFLDLFLKAKHWATLPALWVGFYAIFAIGYSLAGRWGIYLFGLSAVLLFGAGLCYFSQKILPVGQGDRKDAFLSLITFALGTHYAYYVVDDWRTRETCDKVKPDPRVPAGGLGQFFSGPGIVLNDSNHLAVVSDGFKFRIIPPGLGFTRMFEQIYAVVDLRPQLRTKKISAETKDGIVVRTNVFLPHRIATGEREPVLGQAYPYDEGAVKLAVCNQMFVEHTWERDAQRLAIETVTPLPWDERVLMAAPSCLKDVLIHYRCNTLHDTRHMESGCPRDEIAGAFMAALREHLPAMGIELVGGGISNLEPPEAVVDQRIANWAIDWKEKIAAEQGEAEAALTLQYGDLYAKLHLEVLRQLTDLLTVQQPGPIMEDALAFQVMECLGAAMPQKSADAATSFGDFIKALLQRDQQHSLGY